MARRVSKRDLESEVQSLQDRLRTLEMRGQAGQSRGRQRSRSRQRRQRSASRRRTPGTQAMVITPKTKASVSDDLGKANISGRELFLDVTLAKDKSEDVLALGIYPQFLASTRHGKLGSLFGKWRFSKLTVIYVPRVGTTTAGSIHLGWDNAQMDTAIPNFAQVASLTPAIGCAVHQTTRMSVHGSLLSTYPWFDTRYSKDQPNTCAPGAIRVGIKAEQKTTDQTYGEIWCEYEAHYLGFDGAAS